MAKIRLLSPIEILNIQKKITHSNAGLLIAKEGLKDARAEVNKYQGYILKYKNQLDTNASYVKMSMCAHNWETITYAQGIKALHCPDCGYNIYEKELMKIAPHVGVIERMTTGNKWDR